MSPDASAQRKTDEQAQHAANQCNGGCYSANTHVSYPCGLLRCVPRQLIWSLPQCVVPSENPYLANRGAGSSCDAYKIGNESNDVMLLARNMQMLWPLTSQMEHEKRRCAVRHTPIDAEFTSPGAIKRSCGNSSRGDSLSPRGMMEGGGRKIALPLYRWERGRQVCCAKAVLRSWLPWRCRPDQ